MRLPIVTIGNSKGIRLPKTIIELCGFGPEVEVEIYSKTLIVRPVGAPKHPPHHGPKHAPHHDPHHGPRHEGKPPLHLEKPGHTQKLEIIENDPVYALVDQRTREEEWD